MGSYGWIGLAFIVLLAGIFAYRSYKSKLAEVMEEHKEKMAEIKEVTKEVEVATEDTDEASLYIGLFVVYAKDHVAATGKKISSNRLSAIEAKFREGYQTFMSRELPEMEQPYKELKQLFEMLALC